jgi:hypothetical protein
VAALEGRREALRLGTLSSDPPNIRSWVTIAGIGAGDGIAGAIVVVLVLRGLLDKGNRGPEQTNSQ